MTSEDIKHQLIIIIIVKTQSSGAVWKSRWPSWAPVPNKPYGFCGRKATLNNNSQNALLKKLVTHVELHALKAQWVCSTAENSTV